MGTMMSKEARAKYERQYRAANRERIAARFREWKLARRIQIEGRRRMYLDDIKAKLAIQASS